LVSGSILSDNFKKLDLGVAVDSDPSKCKDFYNMFLELEYKADNTELIIV
jgi:hypothetical protein